MSIAGSRSISTTIASLSPVRARRACISPTSFQWRARQGLQQPTPNVGPRLLTRPAHVPNPSFLSGYIIRLYHKLGQRVFDDDREAPKEGDAGPDQRQDNEATDQHSYPPSDVDGKSETRISAQVRHAMRTVPQSVAIVTSTDISTGATGIFRGATISSFNSVTINPQPIVSLNIKCPSSTFDAIESSGYFSVHLLDASTGASKLATAFTKGQSESLFHDLPPDVHIGKRTKGALTHPPALKGPHIPFSLLCWYHRDKTVKIGDHVVLFGIVKNLSKRNGWAAETVEPCLLYSGGQYGRVRELDASEAARNRESGTTPKQPLLSQSSILKTDFDDFAREISLIDHSPLDVSNFGALPGNDLVQKFRQNSKDIHTLVVSLLKVHKQPSSSAADKSPKRLSRISAGLLEASIFYRVFLSPVDVYVGKYPDIRQQTTSLLSDYWSILYDTHNTTKEMIRVLCLLNDIHLPYVAPVSPLCSIGQLPLSSFHECLPYYGRYLRTWLQPLRYPESDEGKSTGWHSSVTHALVKQYNVAAHDTKTWLRSILRPQVGLVASVQVQASNQEEQQMQPRRRLHRNYRPRKQASEGIPLRKLATWDIPLRKHAAWGVPLRKQADWGFPVRKQALREGLVRKTVAWGFLLRRRAARRVRLSKQAAWWAIIRKKGSNPTYEVVARRHPRLMKDSPDSEIIEEHSSRPIIPIRPWHPSSSIIRDHSSSRSAIRHVPSTPPDPAKRGEEIIREGLEDLEMLVRGPKTTTTTSAPFSSTSPTTSGRIGLEDLHTLMRDNTATRIPSSSAPSTAGGGRKRPGRTKKAKNPDKGETSQDIAAVLEHLRQEMATGK